MIKPPALPAFILLWAGAALSQTATPAGDKANGKRLYDAVGCFECHGHAGQGGYAAVLASTKLPYLAFAHQLRSPVNSMPAYSNKVLSDQRCRIFSLTSRACRVHRRSYRRAARQSNSRRV